MAKDSFLESFMLKSLFAETKEGFRQDIQGLRGIAIIAVLAYHFVPNYVCYGFLGVDMFFVISGYLISLILTSINSLDFASLSHFYMRRIKRIVPLYYIAFGSTAILSTFLMSYAWLLDNFHRFRYSLVFLLNFGLYQSRKGYFGNSDNAQELFLHGWSLSVEMQFYLTAPLFFVLHNYISKNTPRFGRFLSIGILTLVIAGSQLFPYVSKHSTLIAFYHPVARLWQFASGIIAQLAIQLPKKQCYKATHCHHLLISTTILLFAIILLIITLPILPSGPFYYSLSSYLRILITLSTSILLYCGTYITFKPFTLKALRYIGDISYSLYLVHWPVLVLCRYYAEWNQVQQIFAYLMAFLLSISFAVFLHHLVEKPLLKQSAKTGCLIALIAFLILFCVHGHWQRAHEGILGENSEAIHRNALQMEGTYIHKEANYTHLGEGAFGLAEFPPGNGTLRVLVLGNSYAAQEVPIIKRLLDGHYARLVLYAAVHNQVLVTYHQALSATTREVIKQMKPHLIFILIRYHDKELQPMTQNDVIISEFIRNAEFLQKHSDHIFIESPRPVYPTWFISNFMDRLEWNQSIEKANMNLTESMSEIQYAWLRVNVLLTKCAKCVLLHSDTPFIDKERDIVRMYDPETLLSYVDNC